MKVIKVRYFETNHGVGYSCETDVREVKILNDGTGGATYLDGRSSDIEPYAYYSESDLENLIDDCEKNLDTISHIV
jgi:hypothetical protein